MKSGTAVRIALGLAIALAPLCVWWRVDGTGGAALAASPGAQVTAKACVTTARVSSVIAVPPKPLKETWPESVMLSPNGRWLAVWAYNALLVRDIRTGRWIRNFGAVFTPRWHPSQPVLMVTGGSADKPVFYSACVTSGRKRQLFRADFHPFAWCRSGLIWQWGVIDLARSGEQGVSSRNFGYRIPWDHDLIVHMASGPGDQVVVEFRRSAERESGPRRWVETYRQVPGRMQWVGVGRILPNREAAMISEYAMNPAFLRNGEVTYLRTHQQGGYALWAAALDGKKQRMLAVLPDFQPYATGAQADWYTLDPQGKTVYYLSGKKIRVVRLQSPR